MAKVLEWYFCERDLEIHSSHLDYCSLLCPVLSLYEMLQLGSSQARKVILHLFHLWPLELISGLFCSSTKLQSFVTDLLHPALINRAVDSNSGEPVLLHVCPQIPHSQVCSLESFKTRIKTCFCSFALKFVWSVHCVSHDCVGLAPISTSSPLCTLQSLSSCNWNLKRYKGKQNAGTEHAL